MNNRSRPGPSSRCNNFFSLLFNFNRDWRDAPLPGDKRVCLLISWQAEGRTGALLPLMLLAPHRSARGGLGRGYPGANSARRYFLFSSSALRAEFCSGPTLLLTGLCSVPKKTLWVVLMKYIIRGVYFIDTPAAPWIENAPRSGGCRGERGLCLREKTPGCKCRFVRECTASLIIHAPRFC